MYRSQPKKKNFLRDQTDEATYTMVLRFRHAGTPAEKLVAAVAGNPVHVGIVLHKNQQLSTAGSNQVSFNCISFASFMGEKFSMCTLTEEMVQNPHTNLAIRVNEQEMERLEKYAMSMVGVVAYNYSDLILAATLSADNRYWSPFAETMFPDVPISEQNCPSKLSSVYCSQAAVLMIRCCLQTDGQAGALVKALANVNSRATSPSDLFKIVFPHSFLVAGYSLLEEELAPTESRDNEW